MIYVVATLTIKPETRANLIAAAKTCIDITRKEKGCILYDLHESTTDPARFVFVEQWEKMEDLMAHGGGAQHQSGQARIALGASPSLYQPVTLNLFQGDGRGLIAGAWTRRRHHPHRLPCSFTAIANYYHKIVDTTTFYRVAFDFSRA